MAEEIDLSLHTEMNSENSTTNNGNCPQDIIEKDELVASTPEAGVASSKLQYDFSQLPHLAGQACLEFRCSVNNFLKGCKWAPDGSCILTCSNDNTMRLFNLPPSLYASASSLEVEEPTEMSSVLSAREGELVYDYCWYPNMNSSDPVSCFFVSTCRDHPIHLWDAYTGALRCSYRPYNHLDEISAAYSVQFSADGSKLYCGFDRTVRIFDTGRPGRDCVQRSLGSKKQAGLSGIISSIAVSQAQPDIYALGSYSKRIGIYSETSGKAVFLLDGQQGGVTHMQFSTDGLRLVSGGRKDNELLCWDLRQPGKVLWRALRQVTTNQRIQFDLDLSDRYLVSGEQSGQVNVYDMLQSLEADGMSEGSPASTDELALPISCQLAVHDDAVNGCRLHPALPILATTSGQRKFSNPGGYDIADNCGSPSSSAGTDQVASDNSLRIWSLVKQEDHSCGM